MITVIWIDWYPYHLARFRALTQHPHLSGRVSGIELVGKSGVHQGLTFRDSQRSDLPVSTLEEQLSWHEAGQFRLAAALWRKLNRLSPAVVLIPGYYTVPGLAAAIWAFWNRRSAVLMTESGEQDQARSSIKEWFKGKLVNGLFDWAIAGGVSHVRYLTKLGFRPSRIARFYDVVDNRFFSDGTELLRRRGTFADHGLPSDYFLYVGRLAPEKNLLVLLRAFARYRGAGGRWSLIFAGDGPSLTQLEQECSLHGIEGSVHFEGMKTASELLPYYAFAGCFVLPSTSEPWGLVVNEAMASCAPVIVSKKCGCAEDLVAESFNGFLFDPDSESELADRMRWMSELGRERRKEMGRRSKQIVSSYSPENFACQVAKLSANLECRVPGTVAASNKAETAC